MFATLLDSVPGIVPFPVSSQSNIAAVEWRKSQYDWKSSAYAPAIGDKIELPHSDRAQGQSLVARYIAPLHKTKRQSRGNNVQGASRRTSGDQGKIRLSEPTSKDVYVAAFRLCQSSGC